MKNLDDILRDPRAHHAEVSNDQVKAWGEEALTRWSAEQESVSVPKANRSRLILSSVLFWGSLAAGVLMLGSLLWDHMGIPIDTLREMPNSLLTEISAHPLWLASFVFCLGIWFTRPLREFLLD